MKNIQRALVSVWRKEGIVPFVEDLRRYDIEILSTFPPGIIEINMKAMMAAIIKMPAVQQIINFECFFII